MSRTVIIIYLLIFCCYKIQGKDCDDRLDLTLNSFVFTFNDGYILLEWDLRTPTNCPLKYHLIINDQELGNIKDVYTEEKSARADVMSPCIIYNVMIRAINPVIPDKEGPLLTTTIRFSERAQKAPALKSLNVHATSIDMIWRLEGNANRCPLKTFYVNGGIYFNQTIDLENSADRESVSVQLTSLLPNSMYVFQVSVENTGGESSTTPIAVQTLDTDSSSDVLSIV